VRPPGSGLVPDERDLAAAREHPRATERRRLTPYRQALAAPAAYAALPVTSRDEIVRWAETRRRLRTEYGIDADATNLVDQLLPESRLRALVVEGEVAAAAAAADVPRLVDQAGFDGLPAIVRSIREGAAQALE
jgi:hypothetical protein